MRMFDRMNLPEEDGFKVYRKKTLVRAMRVEGPFTVATREGALLCEDGYLALDEDGWPYPIAAPVFEKTYEEVAE
jgi:hypothetical protein